MTAFERTTQRCSLAPGPIFAPGPMTTFGPRTAVGSISAVWLMSMLRRWGDGSTHWVDQNVAAVDPLVLRRVGEEGRVLRREMRQVEAGACDVSKSWACEM